MTTIKLKYKKSILIGVVLIAMFTFSVIAWAQNNQFKPASKEKLTKFYEMQFKRFYDSIP